MIGSAQGRVLAIAGGSVSARLLFAQIGDGVRIARYGRDDVRATVGDIDGAIATLVPHDALDGVAAGDPIRSDRRATTMQLGIGALGRAFDAQGEPLDRGGPVRGQTTPIVEPPIAPSARAPISEPFWTGVRAIDGMLTLGRGARIGLFGAPSAGKSTLLGMLARGSRADAVVIGLIGERGREASEWLEKLDPRTTIVCAPSDCPPAQRVRAAHVAVAAGSQLRKRGLNVLVIIDSLARFVGAAREISIAAGESVGRGGYPPRVFADLALLLERGGNTAGGEMTLIATVLSDGGDEREPLTDAARALLDGHIVLSADLARAGHYPAIDVLKSVSRTMDAVVSAEHRAAASAVRRALARLEETRDLRDLGFPAVDLAAQRAVSAEAEINAFLRQGFHVASDGETRERLAALASAL